MSDPTTLHPSLMIRLSIVAPDARQSKAINEMVRPAFDALEPPLRSICGFISYSRLFAEAEIVRRYGDKPKPGFLSGIAEYPPLWTWGTVRLTGQTIKRYPRRHRQVARRAVSFDRPRAWLTPR